MFHQFLKYSKSKISFFIAPPFLIMLLAATLEGGPAAYADPYALIRAGRWRAIQSYFRRSTPDQYHQQFILARALSQEDKKSNKNGSFTNDISRAFELYLKVGGVHCPGYDSATRITGCLRSVRAESVSGLMGRLSLYRAADLADDMKLEDLKYQFLEKADLAENDPLSREIFTERLKYLLNEKLYTDGIALSDRYTDLQSPMSDLWRGKLHYRVGNHGDAIKYYFRSASGTTVHWISRSVYTDLKSAYPGMFTPSSLEQDNPNNRSLLFLSEHLSQSEMDSLLKSINYNVLTVSARHDTVRQDGVYLIRSGNERMITPFSQQFYTHLSQNPEILHHWADLMLDHKELNRNQIDTLSRLFENFKHAKSAHDSFWKDHIRFLKDYGDRNEYFNELTAYLKENINDHFRMDDLIEFLIGDDHDHIKWASQSYWEIAMNTLPRDTGAGRFVYWLHRYYLARNDRVKADYVKANFYNMAPGSYYARAFWDDMKDGDYISDWQKIKDREDYLRWAGRHGGNPRAIAFLRTRNRHNFMDVRADGLWTRFTQDHFYIPDDILTLFKLGEKSLGMDFFRSEYDGKVSELDRIHRFAYIGRETGNLYLSVYNIRRMLRHMNISEDPFSLPSEMLEALYPQPYLHHVSRYANLYRIESGMIYGLMRQESLYQETVVSHSGAMGLMQIMPRTGEWLAGKVGMKDPNFFEPEISIKLGTKYFSDLLKQNQQDFRWASIAYNGGPGNLRKWKKRYYNGDFNLFLENIPKAESRNYCRLTYQNYMHYDITYRLR